MKEDFKQSYIGHKWPEQVSYQSFYEDIWLLVLGFGVNYRKSIVNMFSDEMAVNICVLSSDCGYHRNP